MKFWLQPCLWDLVNIWFIFLQFHKNQMLYFSSIFITNFTKIRCFNFLQFSWPRVHKNFTKIWSFNFLQFSWPRVHKTSQKSNASIFFNIHDPGYTKLHKNQMLHFFPIFMNPAGYTKLHKNQMIQFSPIFMTPGTQNFTKIKCFNFLQYSWSITKIRPLFFSNQSIGVRILPIPVSSPPHLLSSTRFLATCALVGNRATKIRLWEIQISPGYLFIERFPPHLGVF